MRPWNPITLGEIPIWTTLRSIVIHASIALLVCLSGAGQATTGWAQGGTKVHPHPLSPEMGAGSTGTVDILVEDVTDLYGFEFEVTFDPAILEVVDTDLAKEGVQIGAGDFLSPDWTLENTVDNDAGTISYALCQMNPSPPQSGDGVLATITWRGKGVGASPIQLTYVLLGAAGGVEIPASAEDGQIVVLSAQAPPAATSTGTTVPTEGKASPTPLAPTPISPLGSSGIPPGRPVYIALACLLAAIGGAWILWGRKQ